MAAELDAAELNRQTTGAQGRVAQNAAIYFVGQTLSWLVTFVSVSIIPRFLGKDAVGELALASTAVMTISLFLMLGGEMLLTKEIGRDSSQTERLLGALLGLRIVMILPLILLSVATFAMMHVSARVWVIGGVTIASTAVSLLADPLRAVLAGWEEARRVSSLDIVYNLSMLAAIPFLAFGPISVAIAVGAGGLLALILRARWIRKRVRIRPVFDVGLWKQIVKDGLPFMANVLILQLLAFIAVTLLEKMDSVGAVGVYSQASRLFGTFLFVPNAIGMALLPSLARLAEASAEEFRATQLRVLTLLVALALPVTAVMIVLAGPISHLLYGTHNFVEMPLVLQIYALAVLPMYLVTTLYQFLVAQNRGGTWTGVLMLTVVLYALFSVLLIPIARDRLHNGAVGAVAATVLSEAFSVGFAFLLLKNSPFDGPTMGRIFRVLLATAGMAGVMWLTHDWFVLIPISLGLATFGLLAWFLKVLGAEDQAKIVGLVRVKLRR